MLGFACKMLTFARNNFQDAWDHLKFSFARNAWPFFIFLLEITQIENSKPKIVLENAGIEKLNAQNAGNQCFCRSVSTLIFTIFTVTFDSKSQHLQECKNQKWKRKRKFLCSRKKTSLAWRLSYYLSHSFLLLYICWITTLNFLTWSPLWIFPARSQIESFLLIAYDCLEFVNMTEDFSLKVLV